MRVQQRISKGLEVFEYYTSHQWDFISDNLQTVRKLLNQKEKIEYKVDAEGRLLIIMSLRFCPLLKQKTGQLP